MNIGDIWVRVPTYDPFAVGMALAIQGSENRSKTAPPYGKEIVATMDSVVIIWEMSERPSSSTLAKEESTKSR